MRYSSNIGMAKIGLGMGPRQFHKYLQSMEFGGANQAACFGKQRNIAAPAQRLSEADIMATSFGPEYFVTALQMAQAYFGLAE